jgi:hypothetical protein
MACTSLRISIDVSQTARQYVDAVLTRLVQHLVALVKNEMLQVGKSQMPITDKGVNTTGGAHDDVGVCFLVAEELDILLDWGSAVEYADLDVGQELCEAIVFVADLVCQLACVTHNQDGSNAGLWLLVHLLQRGEDKHGRLSETRLGLAKDIVS